MDTKPLLNQYKYNNVLIGIVIDGPRLAVFAVDNVVVFCLLFFELRPT